jgi:hypothetical protein
MIKMRRLIDTYSFILFLMTAVFIQRVSGQELYVFSSPASNVPARSLTAKSSGKSLVSYHNSERENRMMIELQSGLSKNWMLSGSASFSDMYFQKSQRFESVKIYTKYRFLSKDDVHRHFRMAAFLSASLSRNPLVYQELSTDGDNDAIQAGVIATQLIRRLAVSGTISHISLAGNPSKIEYGLPFYRNVFQYSLSGGYLFFPLKYTSYKQVNLNGYLEFIGQFAPSAGAGFIDAAPALQLIFNSTTRVNFGARFQLTGDFHRMANQSLFLSVEHSMLNRWK